MKRSLLMIALLAAPQLALAQEAEPAEPTPQAEPEPAQPTEVAPAQVAPPPQPRQLRLAPTQQSPQLKLVQPRQLQLQVQPAELAPAENAVPAADDVAAEPAAEAEPTLLQAIEPDEQAFPEDPAADEALEQGLADGFADDALFAPTAEAQDAPAADAPVETAPADTAPPAEEAEAHAPNYAAMWLNFLIWATILFFIFRKPLGNFLTTQRRDIVDGLEESKRIKEAAERKHAEYTERLAHLDEELESLRQEMIQAGEAERDRIIAEAETRAARMRRDAQFLIDQQMKQLKADLTREAIEAAVKSAEELLTGQTSAADQERLAKSYLNDVEASMNGSSSARGAARVGHKSEVQA